MGILKNSFKGISWMTALTVSIKVLAVVKIAILARILTPSQFGNYGIALLVLGFLEVLTETGINIFLIQEKDDIVNYLDTAWVVSILRGIVIAAIIFLCAGLISNFFRTPGSYNLLLLVSLVAFVRGFINPMEVAFQKKLEFYKVFLFQGSLYLLDATLAIAIGLATHLEIAMILSMMFSALTEVFLSFIIFKNKPKFIFDKEKLLKIFHTGKWITGAGAFSYVFQNIDNAFVGKFLGTNSLGLYQQSYSISTLPVTGVSDIFNKVMFPTFVQISDDTNRLKQTFFKSLMAILLLSSLFGLVIFGFSKTIILVALGPKWLIIEPTLKILTVFGIFKSVLNSSYSLFLSLKLQKVVMLSELSGIAVMCIAIYPMIMKYGTVGAGYSAIMAVICSFPVVIWNVKKIFFK